MKELVLSEKQLDEVISNVAEELNKEYENTNRIPVLVCVLKGAANFMYDLLKKLRFNCITDFVQVSSYEGVKSTGIINLKKDCSENLRNKEVIIVEDTIDSGITLKYLVEYIKSKHRPKSVKICCLIDKKAKREVNLTPDYTGLVMNEDKFLVGYGFDYFELFRNIPYIFVPTTEEIKEWDKLLEEKNLKN